MKLKSTISESEKNRILGLHNNYKNILNEDSGHEEAMHYGSDEGHDDKELYDLKHDGASEDHIEDLEDDMHYDHIHDSKNIEESKEEKEKLIQEDIKKMKQIIKPISKI